MKLKQNVFEPFRRDLLFWKAVFLMRKEKHLSQTLKKKKIQKHIWLQRQSDFRNFSKCDLTCNNIFPSPTNHPNSLAPYVRIGVRLGRFTLRIKSVYRRFLDFTDFSWVSPFFIFPLKVPITIPTRIFGTGRLNYTTRASSKRFGTKKAFIPVRSLQISKKDVVSCAIFFSVFRRTTRCSPYGAGRVRTRRRYAYKTETTCFAREKRLFWPEKKRACRVTPKWYVARPGDVSEMNGPRACRVQDGTTTLVSVFLAVYTNYFPPILDKKKNICTSTIRPRRRESTVRCTNTRKTSCTCHCRIESAVFVLSPIRHNLWNQIITVARMPQTCRTCHLKIREYYFL